MERLKRFVSLVLALTLLFTSVSLLTSCKEKNREYNKEEVEAALVSLLPQCEILNTVYYGDGIRYISSQNENGAYKEADFIHLSELGFNTIDELKVLTRKVYSEKLSEEIFKNKFNTAATEDNPELGRYYQKYSEDLSPEPVCIMVNTTSEAIFDDKMTFDYTSVKAIESKGQLVYLDIDVRVEGDEGESQTQTLRIALFEESYGWRIASHTTFTNYNPYKDRYEDLLGG